MVKYLLLGTEYGRPFDYFSKGTATWQASVSKCLHHGNKSYIVLTTGIVIRYKCHITYIVMSLKSIIALSFEGDKFLMKLYRAVFPPRLLSPYRQVDNTKIS